MRVLALVVLALVSATAGARAEAPRVGVAISGDRAVVAPVEKVLAAWLDEHGYDADTSALSKDGTNTIANCFLIGDPQCARGVVEARAKDTSLVYGKVENKKGRETIDLYWFVVGHDAFDEHRVCEPCATSTRKDLVDGMMTTLDGETKTFIVDAEARRAKEPKPRKSIKHHPRPGDDDGGGGGSKLGGGLLLGAGIATLLTGAAFIYVGQRSGPGQKYIYPDSTPIGIALAAAGGAAAIGGIILLKQSGQRSGPVASVTPGGAFLGWVADF